MRPRDLSRAALLNVRSHPLRSVLTALGSVIGVAAVTIVLGLGVGAQRQISAAIGSLGPTLVTVTPTFRPSSSGLGFSLDDRDLDALRRKLDHVSGVSGMVQTQESFSANGKATSGRLAGIDADYFEVRGIRIAAGRLPDNAEFARGRRFALIGHSIVDALFSRSDPVGSKISVGRNWYTVVGVIKPIGAAISADDPDNVVFIPLRDARSRIQAGRSIQQIYVRAIDETSIGPVEQQIAEILRERHHLRPSQDDDFQIAKSTAVLDASRSASRTFTFLLGMLGAVSLGVGGIGIMNIMLVSVAERRPEIGLRMAVGASRQDITLQFLCEAVFLSVAGGLTGIVVGLAGLLAANLSGWDAALAPWIPALDVVLSVAIGVFAGTYPAFQAAGKYPMDSLRSL